MTRLAFPIMCYAIAFGNQAIFAIEPPAPPASPATHTVALNGHNFTLPVGITIEQVTTPELVQRPINIDFDTQGRLYVSDSSGSNDPVEKQLAEKPHRIVRLEDTDGDGKFDKSVVFADKLMFPAGVLCYRGSVYVAAPPSIWKLTDTDNDGIADKREEWFAGKTLTGCANDLHGPYLGRDGWIYWCKGAFAKQTYDNPADAFAANDPAAANPDANNIKAKKPFVTRAAHIFRARPDGTGIEPVMTGGMDNPVDVIQTPGGERIFSCTFLQNPGGGKRDGLIHAIYGGIYGKVHDVIDDHPWTGPSVMPVMTHLGPAAPSGLTQYESLAFGEEYNGNLFAACFNLHKVTRHQLFPEGATYRTVDTDFVVSDQFDFHPTDVQVDADGSLLIVDTGGWYKLCCPTSQLHKPDILGAIYRVRRTDGKQLENPRGKMLSWRRMPADELGRLLGDERFMVRQRAIDTLAQHGVEALTVLEKIVRESPNADARLDAVWTATRRDDGRAIARLALADKDETVRQAALHSISVWRDRGALAQVTPLLQAKSPHTVRAAAEALGRIGDASVIPALLFLMAADMDRILEHSIICAIVEIGDADAIAMYANHKNPLNRRAAWIALDQLRSPKLEVKPLITELSEDDNYNLEVVCWLLARHPEWGNAIADYVRIHLSNKQSTLGYEEFVKRTAKFADHPTVHNALAAAFENVQTADADRLMILEIMSNARLKSFPDSWLKALEYGLKQEIYPELCLQILREAQLTFKQADDIKLTLLQIASNLRTLDLTRVMAICVLPRLLVNADQKLLDVIWVIYGSDRIEDHDIALEALARLRLSDQQLTDLLPRLQACEPLELERFVKLYAQSKDNELGKLLLQALQKHPAKATLTKETLDSALKNFSPEVQTAGKQLLADLMQTTAEQCQELEARQARLPQGDIRRGQAVFVNSKNACQTCHAVGYVGGTVGPDLSAIGKIRAERDLLEAILYPSASFVRSYEPVQITTTDGRTFNGLIREQNDQEVRIAFGVNQEQRLPRGDIEEINPSKVSLMPAGLDKQLSDQELADLTAFLMSRK